MIGFRYSSGIRSNLVFGDSSPCCCCQVGLCGSDVVVLEHRMNSMSMASISLVPGSCVRSWKGLMS